MIREVNARLRVPVPTIATPDDFLGEEEDIEFQKLNR
jgi:hypothetical protein